jgi:hypothetical protein
MCDYQKKEVLLRGCCEFASYCVSRSSVAENKEADKEADKVSECQHTSFSHEEVNEYLLFMKIQLGLLDYKDVNKQELRSLVLVENKRLNNEIREINDALERLTLK